MVLRGFVLVGLVSAAALLGGCETYYSLRRDLGVDPVDPPRSTATSLPAAPVTSPAPLPAGDVSQASWAAQRTANYQNQRNTTPVGYVAPPENTAEPKTAAKADAAAAGQPMSLKPADKASGRPAAQPAAKTTSTAPKPMAATAMPGKAVGEKAMEEKLAAGKMAMAQPMAPPAAANKDLWRVHLASHRTEGAAINEWQELLKQDPKLYGQYDPQIEWVDLKDRGSFARLTMGGWGERKEADAACAKIRNPRRYCAVIKE